MADRYVLNYYIFDERLQPLPAQRFGKDAPEGMATDLASSLTALASEASRRKTAGIVFVSDGRDNRASDLRQATQLLRTHTVPVWTAAVGTDTQLQDVYVTAALNQNFLFVDQPATLRARVAQTGFGGMSAKVNLYREGEYLASQQVLLQTGTETVEFPIEETHKGVFQYTVEVEGLPNESDEANNRRSVFARVVDEKTKVLFVEAQPYWDSKFLLRSLQRDPNLEVTSIFHLSEDKVFSVTERTTDDPMRKASVTEGVALPRTREELFAFDCIILGRDVDLLFSADQLKLLRDYVSERGGSVVFARGSAYGEVDEELAALEPVQWAEDVIRNVRFELTSEGRVNPIFALTQTDPADVVLRELPEMISVTNVENERALSVILARADTGLPNQTVAAVAYQRFGAGKVMSIGGKGLWRWSLMPPDLENYDTVYARFWSQMVRWLVSESDFLPGQEVSFRTDRYTYTLEEDIRFTVRTKFVDETAFKPQITVKGPEGDPLVLEPTPVEDDPGLYRVVYRPEAEGEFMAELNDLVGERDPDTVRFTVYTDAVETRFVASDRETLRYIAETTGGKLLGIDELGEIPGLVAEFERLTKADVNPVDVWDRWPVFAVLISLFGLEWFTRRRWGLV
jgi:hypothetical protein